MEKILHEVLPQRFGGSPLSYQLVEEEGDSLTRLTLLVSPDVVIPSEAAVIEVVTAALRRSGTAADIARAMWTEAGSLCVKRRAPVWTDRGKLMPLHLSRRNALSAEREER
jgi:hypothetical protein